MGYYGQVGLQTIYPEEAIVKAQYMADHMPGRFFKHKMEKLYPDIGSRAAEYMAINDPNRFATVRLHERYPEFAHHVKAAIDAGRISDIKFLYGPAPWEVLHWITQHSHDPRRYIVKELYDYTSNPENKHDELPRRESEPEEPEIKPEESDG
jgi:hypothetical protein